MAHMFIFGMGYTATRLAQRLRKDGWVVEGTGKDGSLTFDDRNGIQAALTSATHILSSVPPVDGEDRVLHRYGQLISTANAQWIGYLSSTGVYGNANGAWVDESAPTGQGRRKDRAHADSRWHSLSQFSRVFRLPGIYGPGRNAIEQVMAGRAHRIDLPEQVFSRIHVDDIVTAILASFSSAAGIFNIADDEPCTQRTVIEYACDLAGVTWPPLRSLDDAPLSPMARAFYNENRRIANGRAKRVLGWTPAYPSWREGLRACLNGQGQ